MSRRRVLVLHHGRLTGGSRIFLKRWVREHSERYEIFILDFLRDETFALYCERQFLKHLQLNSPEAFRGLLEEHRIGFVFVNQLAETNVFQWIDALAGGPVPYEYFIHDYFCICPEHYFLLDAAGSYFGDSPERHFRDCPRGAEAGRLERFLSKAFRVTAPGEAARKIFASRYPGLKIEVVPHDSFCRLPNVYDASSARNPILTIGVLGAIGPHKGARVIEALAGKFRSGKNPVRIKVIGYTDKQASPAVLRKGILEITGKYSYRNLSSVISKSGISFFLFPSVWPETFSCVCEEILQSGYPILMFGLGAQQERIRNGEFGWTVPLQSGVRGLYGKILELESRRELILEKAAKIRGAFRETIDVVVPVFNGLACLQKCVESVLANTDTSCRLLIIDDASTDETVRGYLASLRNANPAVEMICLSNERNLGFVGTVNRGLKFGRNHCVILNSDTIVPPGWLSRLGDPIRRDPRIASVTPYSNRATICSFPEIDRSNDLPDGISSEELDRFFQKLGEGQWEEIPTGVGFCMMLNRNAIDEIGYFDEEIFGRGYGEENDWCLRAARRGYRNVHLQNLFVFHSEAGSFGEESEILKQAHIAELEKIYPDYGKKIQEYLRKDPCRRNREFVKRLVSAR
ncbi:MAG TPA: glycosyltransferase [Candidatus Omnitrophota bacterium]|nr:glycosyltransferase [Candidatus Omnitrophota bacterium]